MTATSQDITHYAGDSLVIELGPVMEVDGITFANLSGATARWWLAKSVSATGADIYAQKAMGAGLTIDALETDKWSITITLDPADTEGRKAGTYYHECEVVDASGNISTVTIGKFTLKPTLIPDVL